MQLAHQSAIQHLATGGPLKWPESMYYASPVHKLVYCPIQKVACSSLKLWWARLVGADTAEFQRPNPPFEPIVLHRELNQRFHLKSQPELGRAPLDDDDWLRFVFVRNPWSRLVSAFLNKFVHPQPLVLPVIKEVHRRWRVRTVHRLWEAVIGLQVSDADERLQESFWPALRGTSAWHDELTFRHFVEFLEGANLAAGQADPHWRPQYQFLANNQFHYVGRFERLHDDIETIAGLIGVQITLPSVNRTPYGSASADTTSFADWPLARLRQLDRHPPYQLFYSPQLKRRVADLYAQDVEQFNYDF